MDKHADYVPIILDQIRNPQEYINTIKAIGLRVDSGYVLSKFTTIVELNNKKDIVTFFDRLDMFSYRHIGDVSFSKKIQGVFPALGVINYIKSSNFPETIPVELFVCVFGDHLASFPPKILYTNKVKHFEYYGVNARSVQPYDAIYLDKEGRPDFSKGSRPSISLRRVDNDDLYVRIWQKRGDISFDPEEQIIDGVIQESRMKYDDDEMYSINDYVKEKDTFNVECVYTNDFTLTRRNRRNRNNPPEMNFKTFAEYSFYKNSYLHRDDKKPAHVIYVPDFTPSLGLSSLLIFEFYVEGERVNISSRNENTVVIHLSRFHGEELALRVYQFNENEVEDENDDNVEKIIAYTQIINSMEPSQTYLGDEQVENHFTYFFNMFAENVKHKFFLKYDRNNYRFMFPSFGEMSVSFE